MFIGLSLALTQPRGGPSAPTTAALVSALYGAGEPGDVFDPSDLSRLWQDTAGTTAVTAPGQTVKRISGQRGSIVLTNATGWTLSSSGGLWWLDGTAGSGWASTAAIDFTGSDEMFVWGGVRKNSDATTQTFLELSAAADSNAGAFYLRIPSGAAANYQSLVRGASANSTVTVAQAAPDLAVLSVQMDLSVPTHVVRRNGAQAGTSAAATGGGNFGSHSLFMGGRNSTLQLMNGRVYCFGLRGKVPTAGELAQAEAWANQRTGAY